MWLVWGQETVPLKNLWTYKGEGSPTNRVVSAFLTWDGSRGLLGYHDVARKPLQKLEQFHSKPPDSESPALVRGMGNASVDIGDILAAIPPLSLSLWPSTQALGKYRE